MRDVTRRSRGRGGGRLRARVRLLESALGEALRLVNFKNQNRNVSWTAPRDAIARLERVPPPPYCCPYPCPYCTQARAAFHRADPPPLLRCSAARGAAWPLRWLRESSSSLRPLPQKLT